MKRPYEGVFSLAGNTQPPIDSEEAGDREHYLHGDEARCMCLDAMRSPKSIRH